MNDAFYISIFIFVYYFYMCITICLEMSGFHKSNVRLIKLHLKGCKENI